MRKRVRYTGRVQGVGFRAAAYGIAARFPVTGWVRNEADGAVLMEVQGEEAKLASLLAEIHQAMGRNIRGADEAVIESLPGEADFSIQREEANVRNLVLFDIDATLLKTDGAGMAAMEAAGKELFGERFTVSGIDFAGSLDTILLRQLLWACGVEPTGATQLDFRRVYASHLERRLSSPTTARALPGAIDLVHAVRATDDHAAGLLTGNFAETGSMKLRACGLDPAWFSVCAWGDDSPHEVPDREHLPPVAMQRFHLAYGRPVEPARVTIIGDTVHDVRCARASGCRSIGVATGKYSARQLHDSGADHVVSDLSATDDILAMITAMDSPLTIRPGLS